MAHFAQFDENNVVIQVIVVANDELIGPDGQESEQRGIDFCQSIFGGTWKQTSYNSNFRKHYAGIGYSYREDIDAFVPPQPYSSWTLNEETANWEPPVPKPNDGKTYMWDEESLSWVYVSFS